MPFTTKIKSKHSGFLEINTINGKKVLDTKNANYSYGNLQKVLKTALKKINLENVENILILGMGAGSVIKTLRNDYKFNHQITAIEFDSVVIEVAEKYFDFKADENTEIINEDALIFVKNTNKKYDFILIDLFIDNKIPNSVMEIDFWNNVIKICHQNAQILFNTIKHQKLKLTEISKTLEDNQFKVKMLENILGENHLLLGKREEVL